VWCKNGVSAKPDVEEVIAAIRQAVAEEHEVQVYGVVLLSLGVFPKLPVAKFAVPAVQIS